MKTRVKGTSKKPIPFLACSFPPLLRYQNAHVTQLRLRFWSLVSKKNSCVKFQKRFFRGALKQFITRPLFLFVLLAYGIGVSGNEYSPERELYHTGLQALNSDDYIAAANAFRSSIRLNPSYFDSRLGLVRTLYLLGEYTDAYDEIGEARKLVSHDRRGVILEARILTALGRYDDAIALYNGILIDRPYDPEANQGIGEVYAIQGKRELADDAYAKSLEHSPGNLRALLQLAILHDRAREKESAENVLQEALRFHPDDLHVHVQAAEHHALYDEWKQVAYHLNQAMSMLKGPEDGRYKRVSKLNASLALRRGDPIAALTALESIAEEDEADLLFLKARAYRSMGMESFAQDVLSQLLRMASDDETVRLFREAPLALSFAGLTEHRDEAANWHIAKGKRLEESFYFNRALNAYRRARRISSTDPDIWLLYANLIRRMGFPEKYRDELHAAVLELENAPRKQAVIQEQIDLLTHSENGGLKEDWDIDDPWNFLPSAWNIAILLIPQRQVFTAHDGAGIALAAYFADQIDTLPEVTVVNLEGGFFPNAMEVNDYTDAFRLSRDRADYFVLLEFAETERSFSASAKLYIAGTGQEYGASSQLRTGKGRVLDSIDLLAGDVVSAIPKRMTILAVDGDILLIDKGRWHGIDPDQPLAVLRKNAAQPSIHNEGIEYREADYLGTMEITRSSESLSEGMFQRAGDFDFISVGDEVFSIAVPEISGSTASPDPAFRSRLLAVP